MSFNGHGETRHEQKLPKSKHLVKIVLWYQRRARDINYTAILVMPTLAETASYLIIFLVYTVLMAPTSLSCMQSPIYSMW